MRALYHDALAPLAFDEVEFHNPTRDITVGATSKIVAKTLRALKRTSRIFLLTMMIAIESAYRMPVLFLRLTGELGGLKAFLDSYVPGRYRIKDSPKGLL